MSTAGPDQEDLHREDDLHWEDLRAEFDLWAQAGRCAAFWWRDDDAVDATPALDRLAAATDGVPVGLAVIPAAATPGLAARLREMPAWRAFQHGFRHHNHAPGDAKRAEFGDHRPVAAMLAELQAGRAASSRLFGDRWLPVLVPPWNRIADAVAERLAELGYRGLSTFGDSGRTFPGILRLDCRVDPVDWHGGRGFVGVPRALGSVLRHLRARRTGDAPDLPTGLLTHHLMMDDATWDFCTAFRREITLHRGARWIAPAKAFRMEA